MSRLHGHNHLEGQRKHKTCRRRRCGRVLGWDDHHGPRNNHIRGRNWLCLGSSNTGLAEWNHNFVCAGDHSHSLWVHRCLGGELHIYVWWQRHGRSRLCRCNERGDHCWHIHGYGRRRRWGECQSRSRKLYRANQLIRSNVSVGLGSPDARILSLLWLPDELEKWI